MRLADVATIINDCRDPNAMMRQCVRASLLLGCPAVPTGVRTDLEAGFSLIDALDAAGPAGQAVVLTNVAPRNGGSRHWGNDTPFAWFTVDNTLVLASGEGSTLSLAKKLGLLPRTLSLLNVKEVMLSLIRQSKVGKEEGKDIIHSQFRSFAFLPLAASLLLQGEELPTLKYETEYIPNAGVQVCYKDCFGNTKLSALPEEVNFREGEVLTTKWGEIPFITHLAEVPDGEAAITVGSSGYGEKRLLELVVQGGSAAKRFRLSIGDSII